MVVEDKVKNYIVEQYGDGDCVTETCPTDFGTACFMNTLKTPLPSGYTHDTLCVGEIVDWAYDNIGWCKGAPPSKKGYLTVATSPTGATVTAGTITCPGTTPITASEPCELPVGTYTVTISLYGYKTETRSATITDGATTDLGTITLTKETMGYYSICSWPAGATVEIDGTEIPWKAPECIEDIKDYAVTPNVTHTVKFTLAGYKTYLTSDPKYTNVTPGDTKQFHIILEAEAGAHTGTLLVKAHDAKTDEVLHAHPQIHGTTAEERFLTPFEITLDVGTKGEKDIEVGAWLEGYKKYETTVTLKETNTISSPLVVDCPLEPTRIWKEVEIREKAPRVAWVTSIDIPSWMVLNSHYTGSLSFMFTVKAKYRAFLEFCKKPADWDGSIDTLPPYTKRISMGPTDIIEPWKEGNEYKLNWEWDVPSMPLGLYIVVSDLQWEEEK